MPTSPRPPQNLPKNNPKSTMVPSSHLARYRSHEPFQQEEIHPSVGLASLRLPERDTPMLIQVPSPSAAPSVGLIRQIRRALESSLPYLDGEALTLSRVHNTYPLRRGLTRSQQSAACIPYPGINHKRHSIPSSSPGSADSQRSTRGSERDYARGPTSDTKSSPCSRPNTQRPDRYQ